MIINALPSELIDVVAAIDPDAYSAAAVSSGYADMAAYEALLAIELAGDIVSTGKVDNVLYQAVAASGGSAITGKAITQLTQAGSDSNKQALINLRREELTESYRYVKMLRTLTTAGADEAALLLGIKGAIVPNRLPSEQVAVIGVIDPDAYAPAALSSGWFDMSRWHAALAIMMIGDLGTACTVTGKFQQATTSGGSAKDVTGRATSTYDQTTSPNPSNQQVKLDLLNEDLDMANDYRWAKFVMTATDETSPANATSDLAAVIIGVGPKHAPASDWDLTSVDEIVA